MEKSDKGDGSHIWKNSIKSLFVHPFPLSPQTASDSAVCLCKFHCNLTNSLKFNMQAIL